MSDPNEPRDPFPVRIVDVDVPLWSVVRIVFKVLLALAIPSLAVAACMGLLALPDRSDRERQVSDPAPYPTRTRSPAERRMDDPDPKPTDNPYVACLRTCADYEGDRFARCRDACQRQHR